MLRSAAAVVCALLVLALAGCDDSDDSWIVFRDVTRPISVEKGMEFSIELSVNAGVGYDWETVPPRSGILEFRGTDVEYPEEERAGDSGVKRFKYEAMRKGSEALVFRHLFRGDRQETKTVTVNVNE